MPSAADAVQGTPTALADPTDDPLDYPLSFASDQQLEALEDGVVTAAEYERSMLAMVQCMQEQGIEFEQLPQWDVTNTRMEYTYIAGRTMEENAQSARLRDECKLKHIGAVGYVWEQQGAPSEVRLAEARAALGGCLREAGVKGVPEQPTSAELGVFSTQEAFWPCAKRVETEFQLPGFAG